MKAIKLTLAALALTTTSAIACEPQHDAGMKAFRADALAQIESENRQALQRSLRLNLSALLDQTRQNWLAQQASPASAGTAKAQAQP